MKKRLKKSCEKWKYWSPRILGVIYTIFILLLAFADPIFSKTFFIASLPGLVFLAVLCYSWHNPYEGGVVFLITSIVLTIYFLFKMTNWPSYIFVSLMLGLIGYLFLISSGKFKWGKK